MTLEHDFNTSFGCAAAVSGSAASPREPGLQCGFVVCLLAGCSTCSSNPGRPLPPVSPAAERRVPYCTTSHSESRGRVSVLHYVAVQSLGTPPSSPTHHKTHPPLPLPTPPPSLLLVGTEECKSLPGSANSY